MGKRVASPLEIFLADPRRPDGTLRYHELQGFLYAVASCPETVMPGEWLPEIFDAQDAGYESLEEAQQVLGEVMALYNSVNEGVEEGRAALPPDCRFRRGVMANFADAAPISQWSRGFFIGHQWLNESWDASVPSEFDDDLGMLLLTLTFFSSRELAEAFRVESGIADLEEMADIVRGVFEQSVVEYAELGRAIHRALMEQPVRREGPKTGRNEPCPCGSGRKYKKCCGAAIQ